MKKKSRLKRNGLILICLALMANISFAQKKPNILVIMGDDIGWYNASCYNRGDMGYQTPNIDRIAKEALYLFVGMASKVAQPAEQHL